MFGLYFVAVLALGGASLYFFATLQFSNALLALLPIVPLGIYFRVVMMRRCRDIGWPAWLPWVLFVVPAGLNFMGGLGSLGSSGADLSSPLAMMIVPLLASLLDLGFAIVIGCIRTKDEGENLAQLFGPGPGEEPHERPVQAGDYSSFDAAVARALAARRAGSSEEPATRRPRDVAELDAIAAGEAPLLPSPSAHARAVAGFGRKMV